VLVVSHTLVVVVVVAAEYLYGTMKTKVTIRPLEHLIFKPPLPVGAGGGYMFSGRPSVHASVCPSVRPSVRDSRGSFMFPRYLQYLLTDFRQTFVTGASRDRDELIRVKRSKFKVTA